MSLFLNMMGVHFLKIGLLNEKKEGLFLLGGGLFTRFWEENNYGGIVATTLSFWSSFLWDFEISVSLLFC